MLYMALWPNRPMLKQGSPQFLFIYIASMAALFISFSCLLLILLATGVYATAAVDNVPNTEETIADNLPLAFKQNKLASTQLVEFYLEKLYRQNPKLKGVIEAHENALNLADKADREREYKERVLSFTRLHGINPALVKLVRYLLHNLTLYTKANIKFMLIIIRFYIIGNEAC